MKALLLLASLLLGAGSAAELTNNWGPTVEPGFVRAEGTKLDLKGGCYSMDKGYEGGTEVAGSPATGTATPSDCQKKCAEAADCEVWHWVSGAAAAPTNAGNCVMKDGSSVLTSDQHGIVAGPNVCA